MNFTQNSGLQETSQSAYGIDIFIIFLSGIKPLVPLLDKKNL